MRREVRLGDICQLINGGAWTENEYADEGVPVVRVSDMKNGQVDLSNQMHLAFSSHERYKKNELMVNDLVITTVGSHATQSSSAAGRALVVPVQIEGMLLNQNAVCIRTKTPYLDQRYLGYVGQSAAFCTFIRDAGKGAANQMRIPLSAIRDYTFELPDLTTQHRIAGILSAYDDLIENNRRRIRLLEEAARLLYREWFVHLRFPGHEHVAVVDGVPEGWKRKRLNEVADITMGQSPKSNYYNQEGNGLPFHQGVSNFGGRFPSHETFCTVLSRLAEPGDILFSVRGVSVKVSRGGRDRIESFPLRHLRQAQLNRLSPNPPLHLRAILLTPLPRPLLAPFSNWPRMLSTLLFSKPRETLTATRVRAPVGRINITRDKIVTGRGLAAIRSNCDQQNFLFYTLKSHFFKDDMIGTGAIFAAITKSDVHSVQLMHPPPRLIEIFTEHAKPIDRQIENLQQTIDDLVKVRDLLLPRLMKGEMTV